MATFTENYNLIKPGEGDYYDVQDFNENMDMLDGLLRETEQEIDGLGSKIDGLDGKIGTAEDTGTNTLFGLLKQGGEKICTPSETVQHEWTNVSVISLASTKYDSGWFKFVDIMMQKSGMVRIKMSITTKQPTETTISGSSSFSIFRDCQSSFRRMPEKTLGTGNSPATLDKPSALYSFGEKASPYDKTYTNDVDLSVQKGEVLSFFVNFSCVRLAKINYLQICYDEVEL